MSRIRSDDGLSKFQRYRQTQRSSGRKLLRFWVPDPSTPEFQAEARRQAAILRDAPEETDALRFIEAAAEWPEP